MNKNFFLAIIVVLALLEATLLNYFRLMQVKPDLLLVSVVLSALSFQLKEAIFFALAAGVAKDLLNIGSFGINTLVFPVLSYLVWRLARKVFVENQLAFSALVGIVAVLNAILDRFIRLSAGNFLAVGIFLRISFLGSLYTALISSLLAKAIQAVCQFKIKK